jgi:hypothetical protein
MGWSAVVPLRGRFLGEYLDKFSVDRPVRRVFDRESNKFSTIPR